MKNLRNLLKNPSIVLSFIGGAFVISIGVLTCLNTDIKKQNIELYTKYVGVIKDYIDLSDSYRLLKTEKMIDSINLSIDYSTSIFSSREEYSELKHKNDSLMKRCLKNSQNLILF
jgi:hypothetical protein